MLLAGRRRSALGTGVVAALPPGAVTLLAVLPVDVPTSIAAMAYVLAVVASSLAGGVRAGVAASALSFLALNFFFTKPLHTLKVGEAEDLVALVVFLLVSVVVGVLLSMALSQRARAEQREQDARVLHDLGTRLLSGDSTERALASLARSVVGLFDLARCEITTELATGPIVAERGRDGEAGSPETIPMLVREAEVGRIVVVPRATRSALSTDERDLIQTIASQSALAIEGAKLSAEANRARSDAEANKLRAALFSSVTHDLRTPLASITASVTSLLDEATTFDEADRRELLETIRLEAERLNRLVGNLLDLSRIRAGALVPSKTPVAIDEVIEAVVARLQPTLEGLEVRLQLRENLPEIAVDVVQIDQALTNILENAARFTPHGKRVTVSAAGWRGGVQIRIADQGPGIPAGERERAFEAFVRGEGSSGTGLGLAIAKAIVESHGGRIALGETPGGGTTVSIELPPGR